MLADDRGRCAHRGRPWRWRIAIAVKPTAFVLVIAVAYVLPRMQNLRSVPQRIPSPALLVPRLPPAARSVIRFTAVPLLRVAARGLPLPAPSHSARGSSQRASTSRSGSRDGADAAAAGHHLPAMMLMHERCSCTATALLARPVTTWTVATSRGTRGRGAARAPARTAGNDSRHARRAALAHAPGAEAPRTSSRQQSVAMDATVAHLLHVPSVVRSVSRAIT